MALPGAPLDEQHYVPILKGKAAEFTALERSPSAERSNYTPLVEIIPGDDDEDPRDIEQALEAGASKLISAWGSVDRVFVDTFLLSETVPLSGGRLAVQFIADHLRAEQVEFAPVGRLGSEPELMAALASVCRSDGRGFCLRLSRDDLLDPDLESLISDMLSEMGLSEAQVDLVMDWGEIRDADRDARHAVTHLNRLARIGSWRSLTLAAGSFPADLSGQPPGRSSISRLDASLWRQATAGGVDRTPAFGDYTIGHPLLAIGVAFAPAPQLRYTVDGEWLIWRGSKRDPRGARQFYDHCANLVASGQFAGAHFSWGDAYIQNAAESATGPARVGPGNATTWRTVGVSHHLAHVVNRLTTAGAP